MLVNSNILLSNALKEGYAVPAYNINNLEWTRFILEACNNDKSPVILSASINSINYFGNYKIVCDVVKSLVKELNIKIPVVLHLDHASSFLECKSAIDAGFTSVMIDTSNETFEKSIEITSKVVSYAKKYNVSVEANLGSSNYESIDKLSYTDPDLSKEFVIATEINSFAPFVGNYHGIYKKDIQIDFERLGRICKNVKIPLVLHGSSGLDENKIKTAIFCGVSKININTDLQIVWSNEVRKYLIEDKEVYDPRKIIKIGKNALEKEIHNKNLLFGSKNKV